MMPAGPPVPNAEPEPTKRPVPMEPPIDDNWGQGMEADNGM